MLELLPSVSNPPRLPLPLGQTTTALIVRETALHGEVLAHSTFKRHDEVSAEILADPFEVLDHALRLKLARQAYSNDLVG